IIDLARRMIELSGHEPGRDIAIEVVGIRPGEKLHEELFNVDEEVRPTRYGKIMRATRPPIDPEAFALGLDRLFQHVNASGPQPVADALWSALRAGREVTRDGEGPGTPRTPSTTELEHP
ncbi:MAG TPA: polysaccharide biosynthesis protein, partial [Miltoncostaea sp.]|nr:polysaccharide biosynthesis protein [Miltoncostaea sp.]